VYGLMKDQDIKHIRMFKSTFESFDGRITASKKSLDERNLAADEVFENVEILEEEDVAKVFSENEIVITF
jgi:sulfur relay (sulfurtransferase) DsrF/TusC family protein